VTAGVSQASDGHARLISPPLLGGDMPPSDDDGCHETVTVALSQEFLRDVDEYATHNGYESLDAVVAAALARAGDDEGED